jgi:hypothetical protein
VTPEPGPSHLQQDPEKQRYAHPGPVDLYSLLEKHVERLDIDSPNLARGVA